MIAQNSIQYETEEMKTYAVFSIYHKKCKLHSTPPLKQKFKQQFQSDFPFSIQGSDRYLSENQFGHMFVPPYEDHKITCRVIYFKSTYYFEQTLYEEGAL